VSIVLIKGHRARGLAVLAEAPVFVVAVDGVVGFVIRVKSVANGVLKWARVNARDA